MNKRNGQVRIDVWIPEKLYAKLKKLAAKKDRSLASLVRVFLADAIKWKRIKITE